jgi:hypothetical protein
VQVRCITIETKEVARVGYNVFLFPRSYSSEGLTATHLHLNTHVEKETRYIQYGPLLLFQSYCILNITGFLSILQICVFI